MARKNSNQNVIAGLIVAILALAGLNIYQYINRNALVNTNKQQETELIEMTKAKTELDKQYYEALSELEEMKSDNEEMNDMIEEQKDELEKQRNRISALLKDSKNLKQAREEMAKLKEESDQYLAELVVLREENEKLSASNIQLEEDNVQLTSRLEVSEANVDSLEKDKEVLTAQKDELATEKAILTTKVNKASAIAVEDIKVKGYRVADDGDLSRKRKAENVDLLRVCFNSGVNDVAQAGTERFFVRIISPLGETQAVEKKGSGLMTDGATGDQMRYTLITDLAYNGEEREVCADWKPGTKFSEGQYTVEVYNKGFLVGESTFKLR